MKKIIRLIFFYFGSVYFFSQESFAAVEKDVSKASENTNIILNMFSTDLLLNIFFAFIVLVLTFFISKIVTSRLSSYLERTAEGQGQNKEEIIGMLTRTTNIIVLAIGFSTMLSVLGLDMTILIGGFGFGLGFAIKIFLTNFVAGILMVTQGFYHNGDLIKVSGETGIIKKINALFTTVQQFNGVIFYVPNVKFLEETVENFNTNDKRRVEVTSIVDYDTDIIKAKKIMLSVLGNFENILRAPYPEVIVDELGDNGISLTLRFWIDSRDKSYFDTKSNITETINLGFKKHGINIAFKQITISNREK